MAKLSVGALLLIAFVLTWYHERLLYVDFPPSRFFLYSTIIVFALVASSVTVITGWSGQLSLAQMAYAGIGGLLTVHLHNGFSMDLGFGSTRLLKLKIIGNWYKRRCLSRV